MRIFFLVVLIFFSDFIFAKKDDIPEVYIDPFGIHFNNQDSCTINTSQAPISIKVSTINEFKNSSLIHSLKFEEKLIVEAIVKELVCRQTYQMTGQQKHQLLSSGYQDIVFKLLRLESLLDQQILELWQKYKQEHRLRVGSNSKYEQKLKEGLVKRKKDRDRKIADVHRIKQESKNKAEAERLKKERAQQRIQEEKRQELFKKYNPKNLNGFDDGLDPAFHFISSYQEDRQKAVQTTIADGGKQHIKTHDIDAQTQALMQMQGIDHKQFQNLSGTIFSHQLFQECADHYKKAAKIFFEYGLKNSVMISHLLEFTQAVFISTQHEQFALAVNLSNFAEMLAESSLRVCKGLIESGCDFIDIIRHPKELAQSLCLAMRFLGGSLAAYDQEGTAGILNLASCRQAFDGDLIVFNQICDVSREHFKEWYQISSKQDKVQAVSKFFADAFITPIVVGKAMKACSGVLLRAKEAINFARVVELADELGLGFQEAEELLLATEAGIQKLPATAVEFETAVTSLMESEVNVAIKGLELPILKSLAPFIEEFRKMGGVIPLENKIFAEKFENILLMVEKNLQNTVLEQIEKLYGKKIIGNKEIRVRLKHICNFELGLKESKKTGGYILHIGGGHLPEVCETLERIGLIKIISTKKLPSGGIHYIMENAFTGKKLEKTVFPKGWTEEKIAQSVWDLYHSDSTIAICDNGKFGKTGIVNGCKLKMYWDSSNNNGKIIEEIVTCLPVKE